MQVAIDENGKEVVPASSQRAFQIEPVLEETAEDVTHEREGGSRRASRQESQGADNEVLLLRNPPLYTARPR